MAPVPAPQPQQPDLGNILGQILSRLNTPQAPPPPPPSPVTSPLDIGMRPGWKMVAGGVGLAALIFGVPALHIDLSPGMIGMLSTAFGALGVTGWAAKLDRANEFARRSLAASEQIATALRQQENTK